jgi:hypothetical protein
MKGAKGIKTTLLRFASKPTLSVATFHSFFHFETEKPSWLDCFAERKAHQDVANFGFSSAAPCSLSVGTLLDERLQNRLSVARIHPFQMIILKYLNVVF